nr:MAG TPA: hypothetical protein [Bacteriophage sp.]
MEKTGMYCKKRREMQVYGLDECEYRILEIEEIKR